MKKNWIDALEKVPQRSGAFLGHIIKGGLVHRSEDTMIDIVSWMDDRWLQSIALFNNGLSVKNKL